MEREKRFNIEKSEHFLRDSIYGRCWDFESIFLDCLFVVFGRFVRSQNFYHDYSAARYYNTGSMGDLSLTIARDTRVIADVFVSDRANP